MHFTMIRFTVLPLIINRTYSIKVILSPFPFAIFKTETIRISIFCPIICCCNEFCKIMMEYSIINIEKIRDFCTEFSYTCFYEQGIGSITIHCRIQLHSHHISTVYKLCNKVDCSISNIRWHERSF